MAERINGSAGIALAGREAEYATELWLDDPGAFFLHPEGPLSETTPEEWLAKQPKPAPRHSGVSGFQYAPLAGLQNAFANPYISDLLNPIPGAPIRQTPYRNGLFGGLLPF